MFRRKAYCRIFCKNFGQKDGKTQNLIIETNVSIVFAHREQVMLANILDIN